MVFVAAATYCDVQQEQQHAVEELVDVLWQLAHHARGLLPGLAQTHQKLCSQLSDTLCKLGRLCYLQAIQPGVSGHRCKQQIAV